ncbi:growth/differentiation factor 10b [Boleophthalmus pectinirostris]|uniref:growth/differentiation factor 10b n=1 Tax=Boleophthalmus pectinirostris TaxID=150288 RepID=UPI00242D1F58|nr:growth/differentiation factor 10b [Boleophthalmus pectinirostris]
MAHRLFHIVQILVILECGWSKVAPLEEVGEIVRPSEDDSPQVESAKRDMVSVNMFKVYEKYSKDPQSHSQRDGNTVRSFKAVPVMSQGKEIFLFNLSSIPDSELILLASFHFLHKRPRQQQQQRMWRFRRPRHTSESHPIHQSPRLLFHGSSSNSDFAMPLGNITLGSFKKGSWQTRDITAVLKHARDVRKLVIFADFDMGYAQTQPRGASNQERLSSNNVPYIMVYADDQAIDEPNSVALSLQRYGPASVGDDSATASRIRRELNLQIQTNDIPEVQYNSFKNHELWHNTYFPAKAKTEVKPSKKQGQENSEGLSKPQVLSFDERTMKKARRRQWSEPRVCSRRYLRVDFADIGWSEWVLAPKSFDAYYCAGTCGFPIPKVVRPSNHATIQSIVRAVGIIPGVPEPCCVPEKMSPLSVLFLDPNRNMVLKVYPGMSVDTCACR